MIETSEQIADLIGSLVKAQAAMETIRKEKTNPAFKSKYADLAAVLAAVTPALNENDVYLTQPVSNGDDGSISVTTILWHKSGQYMRSHLTMRPMQNTPQALGSAATYCRRYSLLGMLGVAPDDDDDGEAAMGRGKAPSNGTKLGVQSLHTDDKDRARREMPMPGDDDPTSEPVKQTSAYAARRDKVWENLKSEMESATDTESLKLWAMLDETRKRVLSMPDGWQAEFRELYHDRLGFLKSQLVLA